MHFIYKNKCILYIRKITYLKFDKYKVVELYIEIIYN